MLDQAMRSPVVKKAAQRVSVTTGRLTSAARMRPGFLIVGAQRCGTTSMSKTLSQHPAVIEAVLHKGVHYFDTGYGHGPGWYHSHFPLRATARPDRPGAGTDPVTFESSPYYMFHPLAAGGSPATCPASSSWCCSATRSNAPTPHTPTKRPRIRNRDLRPRHRTGATRLHGEAERLTADPGYNSLAHQHHAYRTRGQYAEQLERLEQLFGRDRIHVIDSGDFFTTPQPVYDAMLEFLGLPPAATRSSVGIMPGPGPRR